MFKVRSYNSTLSGIFGNGIPSHDPRYLFMYIIRTLCCLHVVYRTVAVYLSQHSLHEEVSNASNFVSQEVLRLVSIFYSDEEGFLSFETFRIFKRLHSLFFRLPISMKMRLEVFETNEILYLGVERRLHGVPD